ncbi:MAG: hypothetical protein ABIH23_29190 [bacterium]
MRLPMLGKFNESRFKNCVDCGCYLPVDKNGRCQHCFEIDRELLDTAREKLKEEPDLTISELASKMDIDEDRVADWLRDGRVKCTVIQKKCPNCGRLVTNRLYCASCGYNKPPKPVEPCKAKQLKEDTWERTPLRVNLLRDAYWKRHSEIKSSYQMKRLWLVPRRGVLLNRP